MTADYSALEGILGHRFANRALLEEALTHPSLDPARRPVGRDYDRLEFLGDRVIGLLVAAELSRRYPEIETGELALRYNAIVRRESLARIAQRLKLGESLLLAKSERGSGGMDKPAVLSDALEAVAAAIYLDGGYEAARAFVLQHFEDVLSQAREGVKDAKTALQELAHTLNLGQPSYQIASRSGPAHEPIFEVKVTIGRLSGLGEGRSKREAAQKAAALLLEQLKSEPKS